MFAFVHKISVKIASVIAIAFHEIALALMTVFIGGDEISIRVTGPFTCAIVFATDIALSFLSGRSVRDGIVSGHIRGGSDRGEGVAFALKWEKIPARLADRALIFSGSDSGRESGVRH